MWHKTPASYQDEMTLLTNGLSPSGKKMQYFYHSLYQPDFLTNFDNLAYTVPGRPYYDHLIEESNESLVYSQCGEADIDNGDFNYKVNNYGFRSNKFYKLDNNSINVLVAGCSVTFGMGLPEEKTWPHLLQKQMESFLNKKVRFDNIAVTGIDAIQEIQNIFIYIEKYGKPDYIFVNLPPVYRRPYMHNAESRMSTKQDINFLSTKEEVEAYLLANWSSEGSSFFQNILAVRQLELYCKQLGLPLLWMSWDIATKEYYKIFNFFNMVDWTLPHKDFSSFCITELDKKYWTVARDKMHVGYQDHLVYADHFYTEWVKNEI